MPLVLSRRLPRYDSECNAERILGSGLDDSRVLSELRSCVKVEVAVSGSPSPVVLHGAKSSIKP